MQVVFNRTAMRNLNRERQEYSTIRGTYLPYTYSFYIPTIFLGFPVWGLRYSPFSVDFEGTSALAVAQHNSSTPDNEP